MRFSRMALGTMLFFGSVVAAGAAGSASAVDSTDAASVLDSTGVRARGNDTPAPETPGVRGFDAPADNSPIFGLRPEMIPAGGMMLGGRNESHGQPLLACKVYTSRAAFDADHGVAFAKPCAGTQCFENFDNGTQAAAGLCVPSAAVDTKFDCLNTQCFPAGGIGLGIQIEEFPDRNPTAPAQTGILQMGPAWFGNDKANPAGKFVGNNFFNDGTIIRFQGNAAIPAACAGPSNPTVVGFDLITYQNMQVRDNVLTVALADGSTFAYVAGGANSGIFTGVCCSQEIRSLSIWNVGNNGEGVDNLRYGASGTCAPDKLQVTPNQLSDALEAIEAKLDAGGGTGSAQ